MPDLKAELKKAGHDEREVALKKAIALWQNNGGTLERLIEIASIAYGADPTNIVTHARRVSAELRGRTAENAVSKDQSGHAVRVRAHTRPFPTPKDPTPTQVAAAIAVRKASTKTVWDLTLGRSLRFGSLTKVDVVNMWKSGTIVANIAARLLNEIAWPNDNTPIEKFGDPAVAKNIYHSGAAALRALEGST